MEELQRLRLKATAAKERQIEAKEKARKKQKKIIVFDTHMVKRYQFRTRQRKKRYHVISNAISSSPPPSSTTKDTESESRTRFIIHVKQ